MTLHHHSRSHLTSNDDSSQAESSSHQFNPVDNFRELIASMREAELAETAAEGTSSGPHCSNADRVHSKENSGKPGGVQTSITDPTKLHFIGFACDWLSFQGYGQSVPLPVVLRLEAAKLRAADSETPVYFTLAGLTWTVKPGSKGKGSNSLPYVLSCAGLELSLGFGGPGRPVVRVDVTGRFCSQFNAQELLVHLKCLIAATGVRVERYGVPSRLDIRGDVAGLSVSRAAELYNREHVVCRADEDGLHREHSKPNALVFGSRGGRVYCRVYDKVAELKKDDDKRAAWLSSSGLAVMPDVVTRVEFELRGEFFRETFNCRTIDEVFWNLGALVQYLMGDWLRFCSSLDRRHTDRSKTVAWWAWLKSKMIAQAGMMGERPKAESLPADPSKLVKQILGCLSSALASVGLVPKDIEDAFRLLRQEMGSGDETKFKQAFWQKSDELMHDAQVWFGRSGHRAALALE